MVSNIYKLLDFSQCYFAGEFPLNFIPHISDVKLAACCHWWPLADKLPPVRRAISHISLWCRDFNHTIESAHPLASKMVGMRSL